MLASITSRSLRQFFRRPLLFYFSRGRTPLDLFDKIKSRQMRSIRVNPLSEASIQKYYKNYRCDGCNSILQSQDKHKYGFIKNEVLQKTVKDNVNLIQNSYGNRISEQGQNDSKVLGIISEVERQMGVKIFNNQTRKLDQLDKVEVLVRLQEKIDDFQEEEQTIRKSKHQRKQLYCVRCYSLKYHNKLPEQYDLDPSILPPSLLSAQNNQQHLMSKAFNKHKSGPTFFIYLLDVLDLSGSFKKYVFQRLLESGQEFCIVINKLDIVNEKYVNKHFILEEVRKRMREFVEEIGNKQFQAKLDKIKVILISSIDKGGVKTLAAHLEKNLITRIQLVGFPNTGKTTLLNLLARTSKPTSKVPGTTLYITEHMHKKTIIYDMPGMFAPQNLYNKISTPNLKSLLTWNKFYSPPVLLHKAFFYGGKVEINGVKIILFGHGGVCASDNRWFLLNYRLFWKGLPELNELHIQKYTLQLTFDDGKSQDLEIAGWGFISFRLAVENKRTIKKQLTLYLPKGIEFRLRGTILKDSEILNYKSVVTKRHRLERVFEARRKQMNKVTAGK